MNDQRGVGVPTQNLATGPVCQVLVDHPSRLKPRRVYPMTVALDKALTMGFQSDPASADVIRVRAEVPGALVSPPEAAVRAGDGGEATFYVTPIAEGTLPEAKVVASTPGMVDQPVALAMRTTSHRGTWFVFLLLLTLPALLYTARGWTDWPSPNAGFRQRVEQLLPAATPGRGAIAGAGQSAVDFLAGRAQEIKLPLIAAGVLAILLAIAWAQNRPTRTSTASVPFQLPGGSSRPPQRQQRPQPQSQHRQPQAAPSRELPPYLSPVSEADIQLP